ncbi:hypothetical protein O0L34_g9568 [Tuta absoluta]|nr:hypothetical protein O0L34_g9568 [Tuta absoluta]
MKFAVIFTVIAASVLINTVNSVQSHNIQSFLQTLQQQLEQEQHRKEHQNSNRLQQIVYNPSDNNLNYGSLKNNILEKARGLLLSMPKKHHSTKKNQQNYQAQYDTLRNPNSKVYQLINGLLGVDGKNDLVSSSGSEERDQMNENEYSKVYVILNSEAIKRSKNKDKLNKLLSSLLVSAPQHDRHHHHHNRERKFHVKADHYHTGDQQQRNPEDEYLLNGIDWQDVRYDRDEDNNHNGFQIQNWIRRRGSGEADDRFDKKPMRQGRDRSPRRERGGRGSGRSGGGGGGGDGGLNSHTAIPYIRQHGDIYERDR